MNPKTLTVLTAVTLVVAGLAFVGTREREQARAAAGAAAGPLYPGLLDRANDVAAIDIVGADGELRLENGGSDWVLASKDRYPVDFEDVKNVVLGIARMEILAATTSKPERYEKLGVRDPGDPDSRSSRVTLRDASGQALADLIVGIAKYDAGGDALYVRRAGESQSWLVSGELTVSSRAKNWLETEILELGRERVAAVTITQPDGEVLRIDRPDGTSTTWNVADVPAGRELSSPAAPSSVGSALTWVALDDVAKADTIDFEGAVRSEFTTFDGLVVTVRTVQRDGVWWTDYAARHDPPRVAAEPEDETPEDEAAENEAAANGAQAEPSAEPEAPQRDVAAEAAELNARLAGWAFAVPVYKAENLSKRLDGLLKSVVLPPAVAAPEASPPEANALQELRAIDYLYDDDSDAGEQPPLEDGAGPADAPPADAPPARRRGRRSLRKPR